MSVEWGKGQQRTGAGKPYAQEAERRAPVRRVAMPRAPRLHAPEATVHVVARCNNREFYFTTPEEIATVLGKLRGMARDYELTLYAYTVMSNHIHLLLQAPGAGTLARPLRWFLTETARAFHRVRGRRGHFWERRYRACVVEDDTYGLAVYAIWTGNRSGLASSRIPRPTPGPVAPPTPWGHPTCS